jgi:hypothetical protein
MESPVRPGTGALLSLIGDLERAIRSQRSLADELEQAATGGTGQRSDVKDWALWGRAHAARRVADEADVRAAKVTEAQLQTVVSAKNVKRAP